jgi:hypothetical protein
MAVRADGGWLHLAMPYTAEPEEDAIQQHIPLRGVDYRTVCCELGVLASASRLNLTYWLARTQQAGRNFRTRLDRRIGGSHCRW